MVWCRLGCMGQPMRTLYAGIRLGLVVLGGGCASFGLVGCAEVPAEEAVVVETVAPVVECDCELRSWVVAGRGRHLVLLVDCPEGYDEWDGAVEFTSEVMRSDYVPRRDADGVLLAPRVSSMTRGVRLRALVADPKERAEGEWRVPVDAVRGLHADRVWATPYILIGTNSNSAMAAALREAGIELPARVRDGGGLFGEFPGIDLELGAVEMIESGVGAGVD